MVFRKWLDPHEVPADLREATETAGKAEDLKGRWLDHDGTLLPFRLEARDWTGKIDWEADKMFRSDGWQGGFSGGRTEFGAWYRVQIERESWEEIFGPLPRPPDGLEIETAEVASQPPDVTIDELAEFLRQPWLRTMKRAAQKGAADKHFAPRRIPRDTVWRKAIAHDQRQGGRPRISRGI